MQIITSITDQPKQKFILRLDNNESATMRLYYYESQSSWYFDIEYKDYIREILSHRIHYPRADVSRSVSNARIGVVNLIHLSPPPLHRLHRRGDPKG